MRCARWTCGVMWRRAFREMTLGDLCGSHARDAHTIFFQPFTHMCCTQHMITTADSQSNTHYLSEAAEKIQSRRDSRLNSRFDCMWRAPYRGFDRLGYGTRVVQCVRSAKCRTHIRSSSLIARVHSHIATRHILVQCARGRVISWLGERTRICK